jgi:maltose alpha-D-glucosyltransferase/alpha-amylase
MLERAIQSVIGMPEDVALDDLLEPVREFHTAASILGRRLGEMHVALGAPTDNAAFTPRAATQEDCREWAAAVSAQWQAALQILQATRDWSAEEQALRDLILNRRDAISQLPDRLAPHGVGTLLTRIHGDLHLGQALVSQGDAYFIDFEGEPARHLEHRRAKSSPLRDVAGMLRSFDYAAATAAASGGAGQSETALARKREIIERFRQVSEREFLSAYQQALVARSEAVLTSQVHTALLELFLLEKVTYEICYEAANRPLWLNTPLRGLAALVKQLVDGSVER